MPTGSGAASAHLVLAYAYNGRDARQQRRPCAQHTVWRPLPAFGPCFEAVQPLLGVPHVFCCQALHQHRQQRHRLALAATARGGRVPQRPRQRGIQLPHGPLLADIVGAQHDDDCRGRGAGQERCGCMHRCLEAADAPTSWA